MPDPASPVEGGARRGRGVAPADERRHAPGPEPLWEESWSFAFAAADGTLGGSVRLGLHPNLGVAWYWACLVGPDRPLVTVVDHDVPLPRTGLEIRAEGLWADHNLETALDHWSLGCEAFAVGVDDPTEVYGPGDLRGDRVPFGLDLEWETVGGAHPGVDRYEVPCRVTGEVLVGQERIELDGPGQRDHAWGVRDWWTGGWFRTSVALDDGTRAHADAAAHPGPGGGPPAASGYVQPPGGVPAGVDRVAHGHELGPAGLPTSGWVALGGVDGAAGADLTLALAPVAFAPVLLTDPAGRTSRLARALCRATAADGRTGVGWTEWNQPQG